MGKPLVLCEGDTQHIDTQVVRAIPDTLLQPLQGVVIRTASKEVGGISHTHPTESIEPPGHVLMEYGLVDQARTTAMMILTAITVYVFGLRSPRTSPRNPTWTDRK